jgi:hypothetical protein
MVLQLGKDLLAQTGGDLRIDAGILDVLMAEVVCHVRNSLPCFQQMHGDGVAQAANGAALNICFLGVVGKEGLDVAFL